MLYYRVKPENGGKTAFAMKRGGGLRVVGQYIKNELYTKTELKRRGDICYMQYMEIVEVPKNKIRWFFGARYEMEV